MSSLSAVFQCLSWLLWQFSPSDAVETCSICDFMISGWLRYNNSFSLEKTLKHLELFLTENNQKNRKYGLELFLSVV